MLLAIKQMGGESTEAWRTVLEDVVKRGLRRPEFLIVDGGAGLESAIAAVWIAFRCRGAPCIDIVFSSRTALPLLRLAVGTVQPGARHRDLGPPERARQRAYPASMPMARNNFRHIATLRMLGLSAIAWARQSGVKLAANHLLDQPANPVPDPVSIGSNQSSKRWELLSVVECKS